MTAEQLAAIAAMELTNEDTATWAQDQGLDLGALPEGTAAGEKFADMSEEERQAKRATAQASGMDGMGQGAGLSEEERVALRATAEASGMIPGSRSGGGVQGLSAGLLNPLVELLALRAAG